MLWGSWSDYDQTLAMLERFRQSMDNLFQGYDPSRMWGQATWPRANLFDNGNELVLVSEVPGLTQKNIQITATQESLTLTGERKSEAPEGYSVHREERGEVQFSRSFELPCKVNTEKIGATVKNGLLTVTMAKAPEAQPRQITVKAS